MANADKLVIYLLLFCLKLHFVGQWLPFAPPTGAEIFAERLEPMFGRAHNFQNIPFHIVFLFLSHFDVNDITGYCKLHKNYGSVNVSERLAFCCHSLNRDILQNYILFSFSHIAKISSSQIAQVLQQNNPESNPLRRYTKFLKKAWGSPASPRKLT